MCLSGISLYSILSFHTWIPVLQEEIASDNDHSRGVDDNDLWFKRNITVLKVENGFGWSEFCQKAFESFFHSSVILLMDAKRLLMLLCFTVAVDIFIYMM